MTTRTPATVEIYFSCDYCGGGYADVGSPKSIEDRKAANANATRNGWVEILAYPLSGAKGEDDFKEGWALCPSCYERIVKAMDNHLGREKT